MDSVKTIQIQFMTEKVVGHGEDAPPLLVVKEQGCAIGVFDGMGGAGASTCQSDFGDNHTKAYVASRIIKNEIENYLNNQQTEWKVSAEGIKDIIVKRLNQEKEDYPSANKSILRSKLVRDFPTTMALVTIQDKESELEIDSYWAGDSRCYLWTEEGFYQISKDDLIGNSDPMDNLHNDAPMSNCICADRDFSINHMKIKLSQNPVIAICATDGCFGYFPTPMHFEQLLRNKLKESKSIEEWREKIIEDIQQVTGDDTSLSLIGINIESYKELKNCFDKSNGGFLSFFTKYDTIRELISWLKKMLHDQEEEQKAIVSEKWEYYKKSYLKYINEEDHANA